MDKSFLLRWMAELLTLMGLDSTDGGYKSLLASLVVVICCLVLWWALRKALMRLTKLTDRIPGKLDDVILTPSNVKKIAMGVTMIVFYILLPLAFDPASEIGRIVKTALDIALVWMFTVAINAVVKTVFAVVDNHKKTIVPLKGIMQVIQIIVWGVAIILIISIIIHKSPMKLFTGLGASLAVLSFVFKDSILNLVSGLLLSGDKIVKVGDWIEMPSAGIDGTVIDMTLNTVKVRGWDNTISNVTPYTLTSGTFKNWHGMFASGGRRIARYVEIDINTVKFCSPELLERISKLPLMTDYVASLPEPRTQQTNLGLFRKYIILYLESQPWLNRQMTYMVRHLQSSDTGVPLQIYAFSKDTAWVDYEGIQAALFEHLMAIAPLFDIKIFQRPSGADLDKRGIVELIDQDSV